MKAIVNPKPLGLDAAPSETSYANTSSVRNPPAKNSWRATVTSSKPASASSELENGVKQLRRDSLAREGESQCSSANTRTAAAHL